MSTEAIFHVSDHAERCRATVPALWRDKPLFMALALIAPKAGVQPVEDLLWALVEQRRLATAQGRMLDIYGALIGEGRGDFADDADGDEDYRAFLRLVMHMRRHGATVAGVLRALVLWSQARAASPYAPAPRPRYIPAYPAGFILQYTVERATPAALAARLRKLFADARPAGVELYALVEVVADENEPARRTFGFAGDDVIFAPECPEACGFAEDDNDTSGGWAEDLFTE